MATFRGRVVTPERVLLDEDVQAVMLRTEIGDATYLPGHAPLVGAVVPGVLRVEREGGAVVRLAGHGGFVHVEPELVTVMAPVAELADEIDAARAERALEAAEARLAELQASGGGEDAAAHERAVAEARAASGRARLRLEVAASGRAVSGAH